MVHLSCRVNRHGLHTNDLVRLHLGLRHEGWRDAAIILEVKELGEQLVLMPLDRLVEVLCEVQLVHEGLLLAD